MSLQGVPGLYFHSLFGARGGPEDARASGIARRVNRQKLRQDELETGLADPASLRGRVFDGCREFLRLRRRHSAFDPRGRQEVLDLDPRVFALRRISPDGTDRMLCLLQLHSIEHKMD
jgi:sucrose phosphorylase